MNQYNDIAQQNANPYAAAQAQCDPRVLTAWQRGVWTVRDMTASDLGIVDQLLDDKVGMEP